MDIILFIVGGFFCIVAVVLLFEDSIKVRDRYLGGGAFLSAATICFGIVISVVHMDWKVIEMERDGGYREVLKSESETDDGVTKIYDRQGYCEVRIEEFYRLLILVGHNKTFEFDNHCDSLSDQDLQILNTFLAELKAGITLES